MRTLSGLITALSAKARKYPPEALRRAARLGRATARRALALAGLREPVWEIRFVAQEPGPGRPRLAVALDLDEVGTRADDVRSALARTTAEVDERLEWSAESGRYRLLSASAGTAEEGTLPPGQSPASLLSSELVFVARADAAALPPAHLETIAATADAEGLGVVAVAAPDGDPLQTRSVLLRRELWCSARPPSGPILGKVVPVLGPPSASATGSLATAFRRLGVSSARGLGQYAVDAPAGGGTIPHPIAPVGETLGAAARPDGRTTVLLLLPYVAVGGVEKLTLDMMRSLGEGYRWVVVSLVPHDPLLGNRLEEFRALTPHVYLLGEALPPQLYFSVITRLLESHRVDVLFSVNGTTWFFEALGTLRQTFPGLTIASQLYDHEVGWIEHYHGDVGKQIDVTIAINKRIARTLVERHRVPADRVVVNFGGIDLSVFDPARIPPGRREALRRELGVPDEKILVTLAARMHAQKRPLDFVALAQRFRDRPQFFFLLAGGGPLEASVDARITEVPENVKRIPFVEGMAELWAASDVGSLVSEYEGLPLVVLEALAMGKPFLSTDVGGVREILEEGPCGVLVRKPGDLDGLEKGLLELGSAETRHRMGLEGRRIVERDFSIEAAARIYTEVLRPSRNEVG
jgi:glycosyltransferase involved in cell wall biosynthesis